jgi:glyoxylase-like metal-dependent hydrolase (beta-lactamase superfamily II)
VILASSPLWLAQTNMWVVAPERGGPAVVIDAPPDPEGMAGLLARHDLTPVALLLTHGHIDHMGGAEAIRARGAITYVHPDDHFLTLDPLGQLRTLFGVAIPGDYGPPAETSTLVDGQRLTAAGIGFEVRHTPGHTPGHCCFLLESEGWLFSGDQLFAGSIGRTDLPGGDFGRLMASMRERVMDLPDDTRVLPGHGPETTIGRERRKNPFLGAM